ncbi:hypothetical protein AVEN_87334-1 [Araneus ventricosus]|uniref:Uncharacterized protein n=1 Tax=Araneus ventricosus TaxID=182803 RepID=A0A4Y2HDW6_ARAVE|nr:hypothetical protein AVEN_87334-1 [Araneus ventricosus]
MFRCQESCNRPWIRIEATAFGGGSHLKRHYFYAGKNYGRLLELLKFHWECGENPTERVFMDGIFVLSLLLGFQNPVVNFSLGAATFCTGVKQNISEKETLVRSSYLNGDINARPLTLSNCRLVLRQ